MIPNTVKLFRFDLSNCTASKFWGDVEEGKASACDIPSWKTTRALIKEGKVSKNLVIHSGYYPHKLPLQDVWSVNKGSTFRAAGAALLSSGLFSFYLYGTLTPNAPLFPLSIGAGSLICAASGWLSAVAYKNYKKSIANAQTSALEKSRRNTPPSNNRKSAPPAPL